MLLGTPTDDSVEVAIDFVKECGFTLQELTPQGLHGIFERFRGILHEGEIDKRVQFMIEGLFAFRKGGFEGKKGVPPELDLVDEDDQIVHEIGLDDEMQAQPGLDVFKEDPEFEENERRYADIRKEILGESSSSSSDSDSDSDSGSSSSSSRVAPSDARCRASARRSRCGFDGATRGRPRAAGAEAEGWGVDGARARATTRVTSTEASTRAARRAAWACGISLDII